MCDTSVLSGCWSALAWLDLGDVAEGQKSQESTQQERPNQTHWEQAVSDCG